MTISSELNRWEYNGDNSTTIFPYTNKIFASSDLNVFLSGVLQIEVTDYTVSAVGVETGGDVTFVVAPPVGTSNVVIVRDVPKTQGTDLPVGGVLPSESVEDMADKNTVLAQQNADQIGRALVVGESDPDSFGPMPPFATFFGKLLAFDGSGVPAPGVSLLDGSVTYTDDLFSGDNVEVNFTLSVAPASTNAAAVFISGVRQTPTVDYSVSGLVLTFVSAPPSGTDNIFVLSAQVFAGVPGAGTVTAETIATDAVTEDKIDADAVDWLTKIKAATAGDLPVFDNSGDPALLAKGTALQLLRMNSGATALEYFIQSIVLSEVFTSTEQTITAAGSLTLAHGLTVTNDYDVLVRAILVNTTAEQNYSIGDVVTVPVGVGSSAVSNTGVSVVVDGTNLNVRFGSDGTSVFHVLNKTTGVSSVALNANWNIRFIAYV